MFWTYSEDGLEREREEREERDRERDGREEEKKPRRRIQLLARGERLLEGLRKGLGKKGEHRAKRGSFRFGIKEV